MPKSRTRRPMITADQEAQLLRAEIARAVSALRRQGVSQMDAYARIAEAAGVSESWVRKHYGRNPNVGVRLRDFLNVRAVYDRLCHRVEASAARVDALAEALEDYADAPVARAPRPAARPRPTGPGAAARRRANLRFRLAPLIPVGPRPAAITAFGVPG